MSVLAQLRWLIFPPPWGGGCAVPFGIVGFGKFA